MNVAEELKSHRMTSEIPWLRVLQHDMFGTLLQLEMWDLEIFRVVNGGCQVGVTWVSRGCYGGVKWVPGVCACIPCHKQVFLTSSSAVIHKTSFRKLSKISTHVFLTIFILQVTTIHFVPLWPINRTVLKFFTFVIVPWAIPMNSALTGGASAVFFFK